MIFKYMYALFMLHWHLGQWNPPGSAGVRCVCEACFGYTCGWPDNKIHVSISYQAINTARTKQRVMTAGGNLIKSTCLLSVRRPSQSLFTPLNKKSGRNWHNNLLLWKPLIIQPSLPQQLSVITSMGCSHYGQDGINLVSHIRPLYNLDVCHQFLHTNISRKWEKLVHRRSYVVAKDTLQTPKWVMRRRAEINKSPAAFQVSFLFQCISARWLAWILLLADLM